MEGKGTGKARAQAAARRGKAQRQGRGREWTMGGRRMRDREGTTGRRRQHRTSRQGRAGAGRGRKKGSAKGTTPPKKKRRDAPRSEVQAVQWDRPGVLRMLPHNADHYQAIYNIDPSLGTLVSPPNPPSPTAYARKRPARPRPSGTGAPGGTGAGGRGGPAPCQSLGTGFMHPPQPPGRRDPPSGAGGAAVAELGKLRVPRVPFRLTTCAFRWMERTAEPLFGAQWRGRTTNRSSGRSLLRVGRIRSRNGWFFWKGGWSSASRTQMPVGECAEPCVPPSTTSATARGMYPRRSPSPR